MPKIRKYSNADFVPFHCHSEYSAFDGVSKVTDVVLAQEDQNLVLKARKLGFPALALTDHGNVGGWIKFIKACQASKDKDGKDIPYAPIKPILGCEFYLSRSQLAKDKVGQPDGKSGNRHLNLYAMNWKGYQNLCALSESSWVNGVYYGNPRIDLELLAKHSEGLMCGSACLSSVVNANLLHGRYDMAKKAATLFKDMFKENFFLEVMYHGIPDEKNIIADIFKLSVELDIPVVATNDTHYVCRHHGSSHEVLMCMSTSNCITNPKHIHFPYNEFYLKDAQEMAGMFGSAPQSITNSVAMAERIDADDINRNLFGGMRLPSFEIPPTFDGPYEYLVHLAKEGAKRLNWDKSPKHIEALKKELRDVKVAQDNNNYDFATYFLIVRDYVMAADKRGIVTGCGRGSGYASLLLRTLDISYGPDPLEYGLLWERFLGFDDKQFVRDEDFGFTKDVVSEALSSVEDLNEEREVEDDFGGVDRY